jgi:hypothetical protein
MAAKKTVLVLNPEVLQEFGRVDAGLPLIITQAGMIERTQEYRYAMAALFCGLTAFGGVVGGFIYLVMHGHPGAAGGLLATGVLSLIGAFLRSRLRDEE